MPITYNNRKNQTYHLHQLTTKTGAPRYIFSTSPGDTPVETIPVGYKIYENPNGLVFLRKEQPKIITENELFFVKNGVKHFTKIPIYKVDVKDTTIKVLIPYANQEQTKVLESLHEIDYDAETIKKANENHTYFHLMIFELVDKDKRLFQAKRLKELKVHREWIDIGAPDKLGTLLRKYLRHLAKKTYFSL